jgi:hypothetical protein
MKLKSKNVTFTLPVELVEKYKGYASADLISSVNAGVKEALEEYSVRMDKEILRREMEKASSDPLFIEDIQETMKAFESVDADLLKGKLKW